MVIFFVINHFAPHRGSAEFEGLVSPADGKLTISRDGDLQISEVVFNDFDKNEEAIQLDTNPGHKINAFAIRLHAGVNEIDMLRTLSIDDISFDELPEVPQLIEVRVNDRNPKGKVKLFIITDRPYYGSPLPDRMSDEGNQYRFSLQVGRKGLTGFVSVEASGLYSKGAGSGAVGLGEGPVAAIMAVRYQGDKPVGRSQLVLVIRKGIVNPDDIWYDADNAGYFSLPYVGANMETSRLAFITPVLGEAPKVVACTLDYKQKFDISALFPEGPITIDHWGMTEEEFDILYVRDTYGDEQVHKVKVGMLDASRVGQNMASHLSGFLEKNGENMD